MTINFIEILSYNIGGNFVKDYLTALVIFILAVFVLKIFKNVVVKKLRILAEHTKVEFDDLLIDIIDSIKWPFYVFFSLYLAFQFIDLPQIIEKFVFYATFVLFTYYIVKGAQEIINYGVSKVIQNRKDEDENFDSSIIELLGKTFKGILWVIAIIIILQNLGYNVTALVTGLGVGGIAIAFAFQNILTDIFASFSIYFDKPFQKGDFIIIGNDKGVVKKIGIKSTRIQTLQGEELVMSNKELTEARVRNYKKMEKRRIVFNFGVVYNISTEKLKEIPVIVKKIIDKIEITDTDRVNFKEFGDFSLNFEVVYYINSSDYKEYMDTQQEINFALKEQFGKEGIQFAYPTQTVFVDKAFSNKT